MEKIPQHKPPVQYDERGFPIKAETELVSDETAPVEDAAQSESSTEEMADQSPTKVDEELQLKNGTIENKEQFMVPERQLKELSMSAEDFKSRLKRWERNGNTRELLSRKEIEGFAHSVEMLVESVKAGDVEAINQELLHLGASLEGYGTIKESGASRLSLDDLRLLGKGFLQFHRSFDEISKHIKKVPGINTVVLKKTEEGLFRIDDFHSRLYRAAEKYYGGR